VFRERDLYPGREWFIKEGRLVSFHDLSESPWCDVCDRGTMEAFAAHEWADSSDLDMRRDFTRLLNRSLEEKIARDVRYDREKKCYHFKAIGDRQSRTFEYRNLRSTARRTVVKAYPSKRDVGQVAHWRHAAFKGMFKRLDGIWYLEITPTYHFTSDSRRIHPFYGSLLTGIKRLEHNQNVLSQVLMWAAVLAQPPNLFTMPYPFLTFGQLEKFAVDAGIDDEQWLPQEEETLIPNDASWLYDHWC
jgi:hypothetical protein